MTCDRNFSLKQISFSEPYKLRLGVYRCGCARVFVSVCVVGALSSYKSKGSMVYQMGSSSYYSQPAPQQSAPRPQAQQPSSPDTDDIKPADEDATWSDTTTSDMLF